MDSRKPRTIDGSVRKRCANAAHDASPASSTTPAAPAAYQAAAECTPIAPAPHNGTGASSGVFEYYAIEAQIAGHGSLIGC